ncbi:N-6 DNA methylase [Marinobacter sp.]|uniref:N-6 DNA methylase n=1 Tax=Marinobacter sp. TaxID=50741 RepID=UPI00329A6895
MAVCKPVTIPGMTGHVRRNTQLQLIVYRKIKGCWFAGQNRVSKLVNNSSNYSIYTLRKYPDGTLAGVVSMPSNIFATTGTNVSILFIDENNKSDVVLIDASNLGQKIKDGKTQKTVLSQEEEQHIIDTFNAKEAVFFKTVGTDFSV